MYWYRLQIKWDYKKKKLQMELKVCDKIVGFWIIDFTFDYST
jgi:hypothetical protein